MDFQIVSNIALISINATMVVQLISFLIFLFLINWILIQPLRRTMAERADYLDRMKLDILEAEKEMTSLLKQLAVREKKVRNEALLAASKMESEGQRHASEIIKDVRKEMESLRSKTQQTVSDQLAAARERLEQESAGLALSIMEKLLDRRLT
ncbi:MAG: ATP synthase F0 subunit B [Desulfobacterales bacterium]